MRCRSPAGGRAATGNRRATATGSWSMRCATCSRAASPGGRCPQTSPHGTASTPSSGAGGDNGLATEPRPGPRGCGPGSEADSERHRHAVEQAERTEEAVGVQQEEAAAGIVICDVSKGARPPRAESRDGRFGVARASARENYRQRRLPNTGEEAQLGGGVVDGVQAGGGTEFLPMSLRRLKISSGAVRGGRACAPSGAAVPWWLPRTARAPSRRR